MSRRLSIVEEEEPSIDVVEAKITILNRLMDEKEQRSVEIATRKRELKKSIDNLDKILRDADAPKYRLELLEEKESTVNALINADEERAKLFEEYAIKIEAAALNSEDKRVLRGARALKKETNVFTPRTRASITRSNIVSASEEKELQVSSNEKKELLTSFEDALIGIDKVYKEKSKWYQSRLAELERARCKALVTTNLEETVLHSPEELASLIQELTSSQNQLDGMYAEKRTKVEKEIEKYTLTRDEEYHLRLYHMRMKQQDEDEQRKKQDKRTSLRSYSSTSALKNEQHRFKAEKIRMHQLDDIKSKLEEAQTALRDEEQSHKVIISSLHEKLKSFPEGNLEDKSEVLSEMETVISNYDATQSQLQQSIQTLQEQHQSCMRESDRAAQRGLEALSRLRGDQSPATRTSQSNSLTRAAARDLYLWATCKTRVASQLNLMLQKETSSEDLQRKKILCAFTDDEADVFSRKRRQLHSSSGNRPWGLKKMNSAIEILQSRGEDGGKTDRNKLKRLLALCQDRHDSIKIDSAMVTSPYAAGVSPQKTLRERINTKPPITLEVCCLTIPTPSSIEPLIGIYHLVSLDTWKLESKGFSDTPIRIRSQDGYWLVGSTITSNEKYKKGTFPDQVSEWCDNSGGNPIEISVKKHSSPRARSLPPITNMSCPKLMVVEIEEPYDSFSGVYCRETQQEHPIWSCGNNRLYHSGGYWLMATNEEMIIQKAWIRSTEKCNPWQQTPPTVISDGWLFNSRAANWNASNWSSENYVVSIREFHRDSITSIGTVSLRQSSAITSITQKQRNHTSEPTFALISDFWCPVTNLPRSLDSVLPRGIPEIQKCPGSGSNSGSEIYFGRIVDTKTGLANVPSYDLTGISAKHIEPLETDSRNVIERYWVEWVDRVQQRVRLFQKSATTGSRSRDASLAIAAMKWTRNGLLQREKYLECYLPAAQSSENVQITAGDLVRVKPTPESVETLCKMAIQGTSLKNRMQYVGKSGTVYAVDAYSGFVVVDYDVELPVAPSPRCKTPRKRFIRQRIPLSLVENITSGLCSSTDVEVLTDLPHNIDRFVIARSYAEAISSTIRFQYNFIKRTLDGLLYFASLLPSLQLPGAAEDLRDGEEFASVFNQRFYLHKKLSLIEKLSAGYLRAARHYVKVFGDAEFAAAGISKASAGGFIQNIEKLFVISHLSRKVLVHPPGFGSSKAAVAVKPSTESSSTDVVIKAKHVVEAIKLTTSPRHKPEIPPSVIYSARLSQNKPWPPLEDEFPNSLRFYPEPPSFMPLSATPPPRSVKKTGRKSKSRPAKKKPRAPTPPAPWRTWRKANPSMPLNPMDAISHVFRGYELSSRTV